MLGSPIAHSLSPALHRAAYAELGLDWRYDAIEVDEDALPGFLADLDEDWRGLSLTMPLKQAALSLVEDATPTARLTGAANTVLQERDGRRGVRLWADNTDVPGMRAALVERGVRDIRRALVLGGGATACSAVAALEGEGCTDITVAVRDRERGRRAVETGTAVRLILLSELGDEPDSEPASGATDTSFDLVVSTIPAEAQSGALVAVVSRASGLLDVIYDPWPTAFVLAAERSGATVVSGLDLLVHQAACQVELMTGAPAPLAAMRKAGERALAERCG